MTDQTTTRLVVLGLVLVVLAVLAAVVVLLIGDHDVPDQVWLLGSTALGALAAYAARSGLDAHAVRKIISDSLDDGA